MIDFYVISINQNNQVMEVTISMLGVGIATIANFVLGWLWYGPLFGKAWAVEMGMDISQKPDAKLMIKGMFFSLVGAFLLAYVLAHNIFAWSTVPGMGTMSEISALLNTAIFTWLGFYVPTHLGATVWENKSWKLTGINLLYHLISLFIAAFALTNF